jgi:hypothetical protein
MRVYAREVEARALAGIAALDIPCVVLHEDCVVIAALETACAQQMSEAVGARLKVGIGHQDAGLGHDQRRLLCPRNCVMTGINGLSTSLE